MSHTDFRHRCQDKACPYLGQLTAGQCGCHVETNDMMARKLSGLTDPRPIEEYHEDMGPVLWWCWEPPKPFEQISERVVSSAHNGRWLGEAPYVGSPNDLGHEVIIQPSIALHIQTSETNEDKDDPSFDLAGEVKRFFVGGWPGYHTHFTLIPIPKEPAP